jgi:uncharacterized OsmC-like protein
MNREQFKAMQTPFKEKYRREPDVALLTVRAAGRASADLAFTVETPGGLVEAGPHPATGGPGGFACAEDMLLEALIACSGVTLQAVATSFGIPLRAARILAEGDVDLRGTLALSKDVPVGFREIRLRFELDSDAPAEKLDVLIEATERYCVILQTLRQGTRVVAARSRLPDSL